ncbi:1-deoxy-D-xylulose-5-phosphate synthase [Lachnospiraceae bacterium NSJ-143]|nr:1-deoxy-D-xylulose-5-phosphate synthase [Lachnospiraceae bacterium NSJ-143]
MLPVLASEIRSFLLENISSTGGHLASNLGIVELTLALHYCFNPEKDRIIWDVGHQAYVHKILTGRKDRFDSLRQLDGLSGFPKPNESVCDAFAAGHSSTSISAALGMAKARDLMGTDEKIISVIGDGSITGGLAYEGLNNAGRSNTSMIVVLNDNEMSISSNVGAMSKHLNDLRTNKKYLDAKEGVHKFLDKVPFGGKIDRTIETVKNSVKYSIVAGKSEDDDPYPFSGIMFEELGFKYIGPIDGHNTDELIAVFEKIKDIKKPILVHVKTIKGKGYQFAEKLPWKYHGVDCFDLKTGTAVKKSGRVSYSKVFGDTMVELASKSKKIVAISAAMISGTGLDEFEAKFPKRMFDVAIAEQHAVTFAAGMAARGFIPVFAVYSTFLQRAYDQIVHDVCLQGLHVVFAIDRAGIVGADGETHQGIFDISFMAHIPGMVFMAPSNGSELKAMIIKAAEMDCPVAVRYPRDCIPEEKIEALPEIEMGKAEIIHDGSDIAIVCCGTMMDKCEGLYERLKADGYRPMLVNARFIKPVDTEMVKNVCSKCRRIFTVEDNLKAGGFGSIFENCAYDMGFTGVNVYRFAFDDKFIEQGTREQLFERYGLNSDSMYTKASEIMKGKSNG